MPPSPSENSAYLLYKYSGCPRRQPSDVHQGIYAQPATFFFFCNCWCLGLRDRSRSLKEEDGSTAFIFFFWQNATFRLRKTHRLNNIENHLFCLDLDEESCANQKRALSDRF
jgi:hypothetical protein